MYNYEIQVMTSIKFHSTGTTMLIAIFMLDNECLETNVETLHCEMIIIQSYYLKEHPVMFIYLNRVHDKWYLNKHHQNRLLNK